MEAEPIERDVTRKGPDTDVESPPHQRHHTEEAEPIRRGVKRSRPETDVADGVKWAPLKLTPGSMVVSGAFNKRRKETITVRTSDFMVPGTAGTRKMFHIAKTEPWFGKCVSGCNAMGRGGEAIKLLDMIRDKLREAFATPAIADVSAPAAVDDSPDSGHPSACDSSDPLACLSALAAAAPKPTKKPKVKAKATPKAVVRPAIPLNHPVELLLPNIPPCVKKDGVELISVVAMVNGKTGKKPMAGP